MILKKKSYLRYYKVVVDYDIRLFIRILQVTKHSISRSLPTTVCAHEHIDIMSGRRLETSLLSLFSPSDVASRIISHMWATVRRSVS